jgi:hypothetical protein
MLEWPIAHICRYLKRIELARRSVRPVLNTLHVTVHFEVHQALWGLVLRKPDPTTYVRQRGRLTPYTLHNYNIPFQMKMLLVMLLSVLEIWRCIFWEAKSNIISLKLFLGMGKWILNCIISHDTVLAKYNPSISTIYVIRVFVNWCSYNLVWMSHFVI